MTPEEELQLQVVEYLKLQYPDVLFKADLAGIKLTIGSAVKAKRLGNNKSWPDIFIAETRHGRAGCFLELKQLGTRIFGVRTEYASRHTEEQARVLERLTIQGYHASFVIGFNQAKDEIDWYMCGAEYHTKS